ncbi:hypothetical protein NQ317_011600 [Molorchus minor]|uniref:Uncharacterized protein n=1 Tax=Molorchus minor TaxID=1323400 RepID=A0ABQ9JFK8_9CUCU|nr:hypothetical protein NQ317_011600 [Molorchus minor]
MEQRKKHRKVLHIVFTKEANELERLYTSSERDFIQINVKWEVLQGKYQSLMVVDEEIYQDLLGTDADEEALLEEMNSSDTYHRRFAELKYTWAKSQKEIAVENNDNHSSAAGSTRVSGIESSGKCKFKLPVIELKKIDGNIREWLSFWAQFKKVHDDPEIDPNDKIQYLVQLTVSGSRAQRLVESFPAIGENYPKIVEGLKSRFGRDDLQIEVYIRELLKVIVKNANAKEKMDVSLLYDKIKTQLRALETLGVTSDKYSAILFPLIESSLPQELLRVWQRFGNSGIEIDNLVEDKVSVEGRLKVLMRFLQAEVDNEQRIALATESFDFTSSERNASQRIKCEKSTLPTNSHRIS